MADGWLGLHLRKNLRVVGMMVIMQRLPYRGGLWSYAGNVGLAALGLSSARSGRSTSLGFRARFRDL